MTAPTLAALAADPARAGLFTDFDGSLSEIVADPDSARPVPGAVEVLVELKRHLGRVAVLSGRPLSFLERILPAELDLSGLYGLEVRRDGQRVDHPSAGAWRDVVTDVVGAAGSGPTGMRVESKSLSLTLHYRGAPEIAADVRGWAEQQATRSGLVVRPAKMSVELHPPIDADKGTAIEQLAGGLTAVAFIGDDVGDLPAFASLDRLATKGVATVRIGVRGDEEAAAIVEGADVVADGPAGVVTLLQALLADIRAAG